MQGATYVELKAKGEELLRQAEEARKAECAELIERIRQQIKDYALRPEDLFPSLKRALPRANNGSKTPAKYKGPNGQTWGGGPGRKPDWVNKIIAAGEDLEKYAI